MAVALSMVGFFYLATLCHEAVVIRRTIELQAKTRRTTELVSILWDEVCADENGERVCRPRANSELRSRAVAEFIASERTRLQGRGESVSLAGAHLEDTDLGMLDLSHVFMSRVKLNGANLLGANLRGSALKLADLRRANIQADLTGADLYGADIRGTLFYDAGNTLDRDALLFAVYDDATELPPERFTDAEMRRLQARRKNSIAGRSQIFDTFAVSNWAHD